MIFLDSTTTTSTTTSTNIQSSTTTTTTTFAIQIFGNTLNACFNAKYYGVSGGTLITSIEISGSIDISLSLCCEKCMFLY